MQLHAVNNNNSLHSDFQSFWDTYDYLEKLKNIEEPNIFNGWIVEGGINFLYGNGGDGKSLLVFSNIVKLSEELKDYLFFYVDFDNPISIPKHRNLIEILQEHRNIKYLNLAHFEDIKNAIKKYKIRSNNKFVAILEFIYKTTGNKKVFVVFDSLQNFIDVNEISQVQPAINVMKQFSDRFTYILIHHKNKLSMYKGLSILRDSADSFYFVNSKETDANGKIKMHSIVADKQRFLTEKEIIFLYENIKIRNIVFGVSIQNQDKNILKVAVSILRKSNEKLNLTKLVEKIKDRFSSVGEKKIREILKMYKDKGLFIEEVGNKNAKYYEVNESSPYLQVLFDNPLELTQSQKELIELVYKLKTYDIEIDNLEFNQDGKNIMFNNLDSILNAVRKSRIDDDLAKLIIEKLVEFVAENEGL